MTDSAQRLFDLAEARLPPALRALAENHWRAFREHLPRLPLDDAATWLAPLPRVFTASDFVARLCARHPEVLRDLVASGDLLRPYPPGEPGRRLARALDGVPDEHALKARLRESRRREMLRIAIRDLAGWAELPEVLALLSEFADACLEQALAHLERWARANHGTPLGAESGAPVGLVVLALGKLGGRELNFSSDIDLMFAYAEEGEPAGGRAQSNHEFFVRLGQQLIAVLGEATAEGFVFRVDMRLRPNGTSGPLALSFDAMEQYYQTHGREWERYALIKARVAAGDREAGRELLARLKPFVFRKYLDYGAFEAMRAMKQMIEREVSRKGMQGNVKLGPGGIREIEFVAQALQLIRGGREPQLQEPHLLTVLSRLAARGYLERQEKETLAAAYVFLRRVEHRLQMVADAQTQMLPTVELEQERLALACGFDGREAFAHELERHRRAVQERFAALFSVTGGDKAEAPDPLATLWAGAPEGESAQQALRAAGYEDPQAALALLKGLRTGGAYVALSAEGRARMDRLVPKLLAAAARGPAPATTLARLVRLLEAIGRRTTYLALMVEAPAVLEQLVRLAGASPWIANWIAQHPILLDELIDPRSLYELPARAELADELRQRLAHIPEDDLELQMEVLREFRHGHVLRVAAADTATGLPAERVGAQLAAIAEVVIEASLALASRDLIARHGRPGGAQPRFAVVGYGKLGGLELGYSSDLDIIFIYDAPPEAADATSLSRGPRLDSRTESRAMQQGRCGYGLDPIGEAATDGARPLAAEQFYARLGQRLIHILTTRTPGGILYEVDMRLRPSGKSGPLVASLAAFREYQAGKAWTWEHQALVRARALCGDEALTRAFAEVRAGILGEARDPEKLRADVLEMRGKMLEAHGSGAGGEEFDLKHDPGGIVDIEFMVQYEVLRWAHAHPALTRYTDNIHLLQQLAAEGVLGAPAAGQLAEAYRRYLSIEHRLKLMERGSRMPRAELGDLPAQVQRIWGEVFG
jgi:glutamate-ammonia-ligase adenylyltransferase